MQFIHKHPKELFFILFSFLLFIKNIFFQIIIWNLIPISELWHHPFDFVLFWMPKILPALFVASFVFVTKRYWWTWVIALIVDLWAVSNIVYYESSGFFLTMNEILMASNLRGFEDAITTFLHLSQLLFPLSSLLYIIILYISKPKKVDAKWKSFLICLITVWVLAPYRYFYDTRSDNPYWTTSDKTTFKSTLNPFYFIKNYIELTNEPPAIWSWTTTVMHHSIISYLPMTICDYVYWRTNTRNFSSDIDSIQDFNRLLYFSSEPVRPTSNLYIILVESLESWTIDNTIENQRITPNIYSFINNNNCIFFPNTECQIRYGQSGDGQMINISGLLPINRGTACILMPNNTYPSIAKHYKNATIINPCPKSWNQPRMSANYGFNRKRENLPEDDAAIFNELCNQTDSSDFCLTITISSHSPFVIGKNGSLKFSKDMPPTLHDYLNSVHYMDSCFGVFLNKFESDSNLQNSVIIITGDHTIFNQQSNAHFIEYANKHNQPIPRVKGFVPLIIYSPKFISSYTCYDTIYQMDIYPTMLQLTGQTNHPWHGFGVDVTNDSMRHNRPFTPEESYRISDMIINSNYLSNYKEKL